MVAKLACFLHLQPPGLCVGVQRLEVPLRARLQAVESGEAATNTDFRRWASQGIVRRHDIV